MIRRAKTTLGMWLPVIAMSRVMARMAVAVALIVMTVVHVNAGLAIPVVMPVRMAVVRVAVITVVVNVQIVREPANRKCSRYAPEKTVVECVARRVRIVVNRVRIRILVVRRA